MVTHAWITWIEYLYPLASHQSTSRKGSMTSQPHLPYSVSLVSLFLSHQHTNNNFQFQEVWRDKQVTVPHYLLCFVSVSVGHIHVHHSSSLLNLIKPPPPTKEWLHCRSAWDSLLSFTVVITVKLVDDHSNESFKKLTSTSSSSSLKDTRARHLSVRNSCPSLFPMCRFSFFLFFFFYFSDHFQDVLFFPQGWTMEMRLRWAVGFTKNPLFSARP